MNKIKWTAFLVLAIEIILLVSTNLYAASLTGKNETSTYKVDVSRIVRRMNQGEELSQIDLSEYPSIISVEEFDCEANVKHEYVVENILGTLYRFEYENNDYTKIFILINVSFASMMILTLIIFIYLDHKLIKPFGRMNSLTSELAKGNLSKPLQQEKSRYFKQFLWGIDMLREKLEDDKVRELELLKEKKTLVLSLSHDIKTPLSAMDLYSKALSSNLYESEEERLAAIEGIQKNIVEIKRYVNEITKASREEFLTLEVKCEEIYLEEVILATEHYYKDKCRQLHTEFNIDGFSNCLVYGDKDRLIEVLQNVMENAIKYGDGRCINISFSDEEDCKLITVVNTGCTLKEEELPHLFDSFYRGSNSEKQKGSGLGLYICKELLHKMDGEIFAKINGDDFAVTIVIRKI